MNRFQLQIIYKAITMRISSESLDDIFNSYPKLTDEEKQYITDKLRRENYID